MSHRSPKSGSEWPQPDRAHAVHMTLHVHQKHIDEWQCLEVHIREQGLCE